MAVAGITVLMASAGLGWSTAPSIADEESRSVRESEQLVSVTPEPGGAKVELDTSLFLPGGEEPAPAVLISHGFGGSKDDVATQARDLAEQGYVVLSYTARGFGESDGLIRVADPEFEIADTRILIDLLAERDEVQLDATGDPRVAAVGASYSGALAIMGAATDPRIDSVVALITWHDLAEAFFPQSAQDTDAPGPFKQLWASRFLLGAAASGEASAPPGSSPLCGRFEPGLCEELLESANTGQPAEALLATLRSNSPAATVDSTYSAPTYLIQGMADSLFEIEQGRANAAQMREAGADVAVRWFDGGHDAPLGEDTGEAASIEDWLDATLRGDLADVQAFPEFVFPTPPVLGSEQEEPLREATGPVEPETLPLDSEAKPVVNPPGGQPRSLTTLPGLGSLGGLGDLDESLSSAAPTYELAALPGQSAAFDTEPFGEEAVLVGEPTVDLTVTSTGDRSTLFLSLWQVDEQGSVGTDQPRLVRRVVAPVVIDGPAGQERTVPVALPGGTWRVATGEQLRVLVTSTDQTFASPTDARLDQVLVSDLILPRVESQPLGEEPSAWDAEARWVLIAAAALLLLLAAIALVRRLRGRSNSGAADTPSETPLIVDSLVKTYSDGHRAVDDVSWNAERGQVVGLLGPNGAGKTTTLRMVMGLIGADSGEARVLGERVTPGAPVLQRVGALIEGPGFLPHLTGRDNLRAYWAATGRPADEADYDEVLDVAALGDAVDRPVATYSHGMKQRLGIAQAMLGTPEVLVLDEPTNGLDPPQIAGLRPILMRYAQAGRTVVVSSHLLAEVEMTCTHVVVMNAGRVVASGPINEMLADDHVTVMTLAAGSDPEAAAAALRDRLPGAEVAVRDEVEEPTVEVTSTQPRAEVVAAAVNAGLNLVGVTGRRQLEEVFLGVIASAEGAGGTDLRQVRAR